jgi:hypothetical protein
VTNKTKTKQLSADLKRSIVVAAKGGFDTKAKLLRDIRERVQDELGEPHPALEKELSAYAADLLDKQRVAERAWTTRTTNDAIEDAFAALSRAGIVALQNAGYTMSDGWEDANEVATRLKAKKRTPRGATFYHYQDLGRGVAGQGLMLAFGAYEASDKKRDAASVAIGHEIVETLARFGIKTKWNGKLERRIAIAPFRWRRRQFTKAPKAKRSK